MKISFIFMIDVCFGDHFMIDQMLIAMLYLTAVNLGQSQICINVTFN
jgi:hypothetical protein